MSRTPTTPLELLEALRSINPTAPRLTWYGPDAERVELSGRVLDNWVAKTANYLVDELDAEPGTVIDVRLPVHWRSLVWLLAGWAVGGTALVDNAGDQDASAAADIVATTAPDAHSPAPGSNPFVVAVALPALQMRWGDGLPADVLDYAGEVRAHADVFFAAGEADPGHVALRTPAAVTSYGDLLPGARLGLGVGTAQPGPRVLLQARDGWDAVVHSALAAWAGGGSVVLLDTAVEPTDHLRTTENVTAG
jgi:uncharacterized protein (TIGR03089 family)